MEAREECLPLESVDKRKVDQWKAYEDRLVEEDRNKLADPEVAPASLNQHKSLQELELSDREVTALYCLHAFVAEHAYSNMCLHYHWYVICSVTDCQRRHALLRMLALLHKT